jgi:hypothetical protein
LIENVSIEEEKTPQANRNLPFGLGSMFAKGLEATNEEIAWDPVPNTPVEALSENTVIPSWLAAYRNCDVGGFCFSELLHPKRTATQKIRMQTLAAIQLLHSFMTSHSAGIP